MRYKVTHRLRKQENDQLAILEVGIIEPVQTPQIAGEIVMGKVESTPTQRAGRSLTPSATATELVWQRQAQVGDRLVYHQVKDDGSGCLSFFRASMSVSAGAEVTLPNPASVHPPAAPTPHPEQAIIPQDFTALPATDPACDASSVRSAVRVGLAVNLLALTVGGYLLQFSPAGMEANFAEKTTEQPQHLAKVLSSDVLEPAQVQIEAQAHQLLQTAYRHAMAKDFAGALNTLKQIPTETSAFAVAQTKMVEYSELQQLQVEAQAHQLLQTAYNLAVENDFAGAISLIQQIPQGTVAYAKVEPKLAEYSEKQRIQAETNGWNVGTLPDPNPVLVSSHPTGTQALSSSFSAYNILPEISFNPGVFSLPKPKIGG